MLEDDATQLGGSIAVSIEPATQQAHRALDAALTVDIESVGEYAVRIAQRHADRVGFPVGPQAIDGAVKARVALPRRGVQTGERRGQEVVRQRFRVDRLPRARARVLERQ